MFTVLYLFIISVTINVTGNSAQRLWNKHMVQQGEGKGKTHLVDTDTDWAHITQESLIKGLITVQYELRMKRFNLT